MAACSNAGSTISGSTRRISSSTMARGGAMNNKGGVSASSNNSEANSSGETSSGGSFSCMTTTSSSSGRSSDGGAATAAAASSSHTVPPMGLRRAGGNGGGNGNGGGKTNKKRFVGVRQRPSGRWVAEIKDTTQKIRLWLGTFDTAEGAARAYDEAAWLLRGANTRTNFVPSTNSSEAPALPSKAARILQSRRNCAHAAKSGNNSVMNGSNRKEQQQQQLPQTIACVKSEPMSRSEATTPSPVSSPDQPACVPASVMASEADDNNQLNTRIEASVHNNNIAVTKFESENFCSDVSKSESCSFESSVDEMCDLEESPAPEFNATSSLSSGAAEDRQHPAASQTTVFEGADDAPRRFETIVKQEIPRDYCQTGDSSAIRENRKDYDYCSEPPQESFVDDTDMTSGLAGLDDGNFSSVDSVYLFDFSANTGSGLDAGSDHGNFILSSDDDCVSEDMRRMNYERQISADLYAMNGVQEYLSMSQGGPGMSLSSPFGMSSPSLTLAKGFRRSSSGPFLTASPGVWKTSSTASNGNSSWVTPVNNSSSSASTGNANGESVESPREDALWQSWDLGPICAVASC